MRETVQVVKFESSNEAIEVEKHRVVVSVVFGDATNQGRTCSNDHPRKGPFTTAWAMASTMGVVALAENLTPY